MSFVGCAGSAKGEEDGFCIAGSVMMFVSRFSFDADADADALMIGAEQSE